MIDHALHGRQIRLAEVGEAGQERLGSAELVVRGGGDAREVQTAYLRGAGVRVHEQEAGVKAKEAAEARAETKIYADAVKAMGVRDVAAREVAEGAFAALVAMRRILGVGAA